MIKKEILTLNVQKVVCLAKTKTSRKLDESAPTNMLRPNKNVVFSGKINKTVGGTVALLFLMLEKEILKRSTSKHAKKMYLGYETGQNSSDSKKNMIFR